MLFSIYRASKMSFFYCCYDNFLGEFPLLYLGISQLGKIFQSKAAQGRDFDEKTRQKE